MHRCIQCGHEWTSASDCRPGRCPECGTKNWDSNRQEAKRASKRSAVAGDKELESRILELHSQGLSTVEIAMRTGAPCSVVIDAVKERASKIRE